MRELIHVYLNLEGNMFQNNFCNAIQPCGEAIYNRTDWCGAGLDGEGPRRFIKKWGLPFGIAFTALCCLFVLMPASATAAPSTQGTAPVPPTITVVNEVMPASDLGRFNLLVSNNIVASDVGNGGSSGSVLVSPGVHIISETAATGTDLNDYDTTIRCVNGANQPIGSITNGISLGIQVALNQEITCTITNVRKNALKLTKTDNGASTQPGGSIAYELMYTNSGNSALTGVLIVETVPAYTTFDAAASSNGWACSGSGDAGDSCSYGLGTVNGGASNSAPIIFAVQVDSPITVGGVGSINNLARIVDDSGLNVATASESTPLDTNPMLLVSKVDSLQNDSDGDGVASAGDTIAYSISIENSGDSPVTAVALNDSPDPYTILTNSSVSTSSGVVLQGNNPGDQNLEIDIGVLLPGAMVAVQYQVTIDSSLPVTVTQVANQAIVTSAELPAVASDDPDTFTANDPTIVSLSTAPVLLASQTDTLLVDADGDGFPSPGDTLLLEAVISNSGNGSATNLIFTETLDPNTKIIANSLTASQGSITDGSDAGDTSLEVFIGTLQPNESATIRYEVMINQPLPANVNAILLQGVVSSDQLPDVLTDDLALPAAQDSTSISVAALASMSLTKRDLLFVDGDNDDLVSANDILFFRLEVVNNGNAASANLLFEDLPPVHTSLIAGSVQTDQGTVLLGNSSDDSKIQVDLGSIAGGGERVAITYQVRVNSVLPVNTLQSQAQLKNNSPTNSNIIVVSDDPDTPEVGDVTLTVVQMQFGNTDTYLPMILSQ